MTISYDHIAALNKAAKASKPIKIDTVNAEAIATLPGFVGNLEYLVGFIMHRPAPSAERVMVLLSVLDGQYYLEATK